jgi:hypothetical protein
MLGHRLGLDHDQVKEIDFDMMGKEGHGVVPGKNKATEFAGA